MNQNKPNNPYLENTKMIRVSSNIKLKPLFESIKVDLPIEPQIKQVSEIRSLSKKRLKSFEMNL